MVSKPMLFADVALPSSAWRTEVTELIQSATEWFETIADNETGISVKILSNNEVFAIKERASLTALISADENHGPFGALLVLALAKKFGAVAYDAYSEVVPLKPFNPSATWLSGADGKAVAAVAEALGLKAPGLKFKPGKQPPRLFT